MLTNLLNPKAALFFLSFLPQFVSPQTEFVFGTSTARGLIFFTSGTVWYLVLVYGSSWLTAKFRANPQTGGMLKKLTGTLFIGLGIKLALSRQ